MSSCFSSPDSDGYDCFDFEMGDVFGDLFAITHPELRQPELVSTSDGPIVQTGSPFKAHASHVNHFLAEYSRPRGGAEPVRGPLVDHEEDPFSDCFSVHLNQDVLAESGDTAFEWALVDVTT